MAVISLMFLCIHAYAQEKSGTKAELSFDIAAAVQKSALVEFSHSFAAHWSAYGSVKIQAVPEFHTGARFWPGSFCEGAYLGLSCFHGGRTDLGIGCGYAFRIWKCIGFRAGYELRLLNCINGGRAGAEGITIKISYLF